MPSLFAGDAGGGHESFPLSSGFFAEDEPKYDVNDAQKLLEVRDDEWFFH